ncbi:reductase [Seminavis robusta]|uniref:Reductase n=1 Tax=Seminavis robusta TaxID=568900 RepID=A0A9N8DP61_9STRA|nr:reductase [Seminavis robusta]|eukprot:Sro257_g101000.1 reductase (380) ;mRNA; r:80275-81414
MAQRILVALVLIWTCSLHCALSFPDGKSNSGGIIVPASTTGTVSSTGGTSTPQTFGFQEDAKTGEAKFIEMDHPSTATTTKDDQQNPLGPSTRQSSSSGNYHIKATILTVLMAALWSPMFYPTAIIIPPEHVPLLYTFRGIVTFLYLLECALSSTRRYLSNSLSPQDLQQYLKDLKEASPTIVWLMECYHYRHVRRYRSSSRGRRRSSSTHHEKVVTHRARKEFAIDRWRDATETKSLDRAVTIGEDTDPFSCATNGGSSTTCSTPLMSGGTFVKTTLTKLFWLTNPSIGHRYLMEKELFYHQESRHDVHHEFTMKLQLQNVDYRNKILVVRTGLSDVAFASQLWFWIASLLGLTVPYRMWFSRHCLQTSLNIVKELEA